MVRNEVTLVFKAEDRATRGQDRIVRVVHSRFGPAFAPTDSLGAQMANTMLSGAEAGISTNATPFWLTVLTTYTTSVVRFRDYIVRRQQL
ncbi:hypothetical protein PsYK624_015730 [Phanerochaete sordida]|uniref:Uncharacterized protein n=1 Tax=Phanerochaete sordida TaxID=48140 RepID=A0A9P3L8G6_9APHY|nr:hypothetical protein PsYK624_015730 [Phanerochaete sordida]